MKRYFVADVPERFNDYIPSNKLRFSMDKDLDRYLDIAEIPALVYLDREKLEKEILSVINAQCDIAKLSYGATWENNRVRYDWTESLKNKLSKFLCAYLSALAIPEPQKDKPDDVPVIPLIQDMVIPSTLLDDKRGHNALFQVLLGDMSTLNAIIKALYRAGLAKEK
jgi:hypothetical protein